MKIKLIKTGNKKIHVVKLIKDLTDLGLRESKEISETPNYIFEVSNSKLSFSNIESNFKRIGAKVELVSGNNVVLENDNENLKIKLIKTGNKKIHVVKLIKDLTDLGLRESKEISETPNYIFEVSNSKLSFSNIESNFKRIGAKVELVSGNNIRKLISKQNISLTTYTVKVKTSGKSKIETIKIIRKYSSLGLAVAKSLVDNLPAEFYVKLSTKLCLELKEDFNKNSVKHTVENKATEVATSNDFISKPEPVFEKDNTVNLRITIEDVSEKSQLTRLLRSVFELSFWEAIKFTKKSNNIIYCTILESKIEVLKNKLSKSETNIEIKIIPPNSFIPSNAIFTKVKND